MTRIFLGVLAAAVLPASAQAATQKVTPPGNSAVNQYVEQIPTANGGTPSGSLPIGRSHGGASPGGGRSGGGGPISASTRRALASQGRDGAAAAGLAAATAPVSLRPVPSTASQNAPAGGASQIGAPRALSTGGNGSSPTSSVLSALTGSGSGNGLGVLLPVILAASLLGAVMLRLLRRRGTTA